MQNIWEKKGNLSIWECAFEIVQKSGLSAVTVATPLPLKKRTSHMSFAWTFFQLGNLLEQGRGRLHSCKTAFFIWHVCSQAAWNRVCLEIQQAEKNVRLWRVTGAIHPPPARTWPFPLLLIVPHIRGRRSFLCYLKIEDKVEDNFTLKSVWTAIIVSNARSFSQKLKNLQ